MPGLGITIRTGRVDGHCHGQLLGWRILLINLGPFGIRGACAEFGIGNLFILVGVEDDVIGLAPEITEHPLTLVLPETELLVFGTRKVDEFGAPRIQRCGCAAHESSQHGAAGTNSDVETVRIRVGDGVVPVVCFISRDCQPEVLENRLRMKFFLLSIKEIEIKYQGYECRDGQHGESGNNEHEPLTA